MTLSWKELVCHGLLVEIGEPSLVKELLKMTMKERWLFLEEEAREFHSRNKEAKDGCHPLHTKVVDELLSSWKERIPEQRRRAVMMNKESSLLRWRGGEDDIWELRKQYPTLVKSINWYGEIHEGRYYLFWDKKIGKSISDAAKRRKQQRSFLMSGFDINIIDGEGLYRRASDIWIYAFNQWCQDPSRQVGRPCSEFLMVHGIGKKEKMLIDDMFH